MGLNDLSRSLQQIARTQHEHDRRLMRAEKPRIPPTVTNVLSFSATGDGTTDDRAALESAWAHATATHSTLYVPTGVYKVSDTLNFAAGSFDRIEFAPGASITADAAVNWTGKTVVMLRGGVNNTYVNLNVVTGACVVNPVCGITNCRTVGTNIGAGGHDFYNVQTSGPFTGAAFYNHGGEVLAFYGGFIQCTSGATFYDSSVDTLGVTGNAAGSDTRRSFYRTVFAAYSTGTAQHSYITDGAVSELAFHDCYWSIPAASHCIHAIGASTLNDVTIDGGRCEGTADAASRFLYLSNTLGCGYFMLGNFVWTVVSSDTAIEIVSPCVLNQSRLQILNGGTGAKLAIVRTGAYIRLCEIHTYGVSNSLQVDAGGTMSENVIYTNLDVSPIVNSGTVSANLIIMASASLGAGLTVDSGSGLYLATGNANGQSVILNSTSELLTIAASATTNTAMDIPANAVIFGVSVRVTVVIPTAATFTVTGATSGTVFDTAGVPVAANTTDPGTKSCPYFNASAQKVRITPDLTPGTNTGRVRVTIHYYTVQPATS